VLRNVAIGKRSVSHPGPNQGALGSGLEPEGSDAGRRRSFSRTRYPATEPVPTDQTPAGGDAPVPG
jgi:hypothetical protein